MANTKKSKENVKWSKPTGKHGHESGKKIPDERNKVQEESKQATLIMDLAFLAPDIIESIIAGRQPADLNVEKLTKRIDLPLEWAQQHRLLGFN
jgi:hypothetical protein